MSDCRTCSILSPPLAPFHTRLWIVCLYLCSPASVKCCHASSDGALFLCSSELGSAEQSWAQGWCSNPGNWQVAALPLKQKNINTNILNLKSLPLLLPCSQLGILHFKQTALLHPKSAANEVGYLCRAAFPVRSFVQRWICCAECQLCSKIPLQKTLNTLFNQLFGECSQIQCCFLCQAVRMETQTG